MPERKLTPEQRAAAIERTRRWRAANREKYLADRRDRYWRDAESNKEASREYRREHLDDRRAVESAYKATNRDAINERARARYQADPRIRERMVARMNAWATKHPASVFAHRTTTRLRRYGFTDVEIETIERTAIFERDGGICGICSQAVNPKRFHIDHIVPVRVGGPHVASNLQLAHPACNARKG